ncbi:hypothetical protein QBC46DRAFT_355506 [Diplogelasinospora grovesii]|uniref:Uncharacterized protein n=1 Tax=Diplogelasinospora grovesii TaxID=303347 RepID=A0AAN6N455_9PEZI|nr:hypothetical protein QBC46DRAFT_355506 [Diplogelasinospora grovesii]
MGRVRKRSPTTPTRLSQRFRTGKAATLPPLLAKKGILSKTIEILGSVFGNSTEEETSTPPNSARSNPPRSAARRAHQPPATTNGSNTSAVRSPQPRPDTPRPAVQTNNVLGWSTGEYRPYTSNVRRHNGGSANYTSSSTTPLYPNPLPSPWASAEKYGATTGEFNPYRPDKEAREHIDPDHDFTLQARRRRNAEGGLSIAGPGNAFWPQGMASGPPIKTSGRRGAVSGQSPGEPSPEAKAGVHAIATEFHNNTAPAPDPSSASSDPRVRRSGRPRKITEKLRESQTQTQTDSNLYPALREIYQEITFSTTPSPTDTTPEKPEKKNAGNGRQKIQWPPPPGTMLCMECFMEEATRAQQIRQTFLQVFRILGGDDVFNTIQRAHLIHVTDSDSNPPSSTGGNPKKRCRSSPHPSIRRRKSGKDEEYRASASEEDEEVAEIGVRGRSTTRSFVRGVAKVATEKDAEILAKKATANPRGQTAFNDLESDIKGLILLKEYLKQLAGSIEIEERVEVERLLEEVRDLVGWTVADIRKYQQDAKAALAQAAEGLCSVPKDKGSSSSQNSGGERPAESESALASIERTLTTNYSKNPKSSHGSSQELISLVDGLPSVLWDAVSCLLTTTRPEQKLKSDPSSIPPSSPVSPASDEPPVKRQRRFGPGILPEDEGLQNWRWGHLKRKLGGLSLVRDMALRCTYCTSRSRPSSGKKAISRNITPWHDMLGPFDDRQMQDFSADLKSAYDFLHIVMHLHRGALSVDYAGLLFCVDLSADDYNNADDKTQKMPEPKIVVQHVSSIFDMATEALYNRGDVIKSLIKKEQEGKERQRREVQFAADAIPIVPGVVIR